MSEFNQNQYINKYIKEKYDRINLTMKAGKKEKIKSAASKRGMSVNEYINCLIDNDLLQCKLRSNGMPVPLLRNGYSIFNGTKYR